MLNYYDEKIAVIEKLIKEKKYKKASTEIMEELNVPYVPQIYEATFTNMLHQVQEQLDSNEIHKTISRDVAIDFLVSNDDEKETIALELLREHNLHLDKNIIKKRIETWGPEKNMLKSYLFEILVEQNIDVDIKINEITLNPIKNGSILEHKEVKETIKEFDILFEKNPSWKELAISEFHKFLLLTYPAVPSDSKKFSNDIFKIIESYFENNIELTEQQQKIKALLSK